MYISVFFLQPNIFLTRTRTARRNDRRGFDEPERDALGLQRRQPQSVHFTKCHYRQECARARVQIAIVRITMPPPDDECYWITPPIQPRYRTHRSVRLRAMPGNTSNTINCSRYDLGDDDKPMACSIKTPKRSIYRGKIHFRWHLEFTAQRQFAGCVPFELYALRSASDFAKLYIVITDSN